MITTAKSEFSNLKDELDFGCIGVISIVAALGGLLFCYGWVVIGGAKPFFESFFQTTRAVQSGWAKSCPLIGCLAGALVAGMLSDKFGRKRVQVVNWSLVRNLPEGAPANSFIMPGNGHSGWRWIFGLTAIPSLLFFVGMFLFLKVLAGWRKTENRTTPASSYKRSAAKVIQAPHWAKLKPRS
jgi:MFS family permease